MSPIAGPHALASLARRQARLRMIRVAGEVIDAVSASVACRSPRTPHAQKLPPGRGTTARAGGRLHRFSLFREAGRAANTPNPWMRTIWGGALSGSTKRRAVFANLFNPRIGLFFPRNHMFFPQVCFLMLQPLSLSISLFFRERKGGERGSSRCQAPSTGCECKPGIQNLRLVEKMGFRREFRGCPRANFFNNFKDLASAGHPVHGISGEMPLSPCAMAAPGGVHGPL